MCNPRCNVGDFLYIWLIFKCLKMEKLLELCTEFTLYKFILMAFVAVMLTDKFSASMRIKELLRISVYRRIKILDCAPCFSFWISLICTLEPCTALAVFLYIYVIDKIIK